MSRYIPRQQPRIPYTWQPSPAAPSSKTPTSYRVGPIKLKGVDLPTFDGEDKVEYEQWKAAFTSAVDYADIPVNEKMLRLQNSLKGKALKLVKDLGFSSNAYERAKQKLEKKYGGQRRLQIKTLTALKNWKKVQSKNLSDLEEFLTVFDRTLITLKDTCEKQGDLFGQSLNLISKEKLPEEDVQCYKSWLIEHSKEDTFETLVEWVELRVQIMEEAKEETKGLGTSKERNGDQRINRGRRERGFNTMSKGNLKCVVQTCKNNHPPWTCDAFKALSVSNRKALIEKSRRCYRCLGVGHKAIECTRARRRGVDGCDSTQHNRLLHTPRRLDQNCQNGSHSVTPQQAMKDSSQQTRSRLPDDKDSAQQSGAGEITADTRSYVTHRTDHISLMVLPAVIKNDKKELKVNVMLDPCSTGSYVTEAAAEELQLNGETHDLTISGTGGSQVKKQSKQVSLVVTSLNRNFSENLSANVLDNITGDTPAFNWEDLKAKWPHLASISFEQTSRRKQIDVLIGSDHPLFHHVLKEVQGSKTTDPIARLTNLGWVCFGPTIVEEHRRKSRSYFTRTYRSSQVEQPTVQQQDHQLRQFWELEALGIKDTDDRTFDEKEAVVKVTESTIYDKGRYSVGIPWKKEEPNLNNNYDMALIRLKSQEKSLKRKGSEATHTYNKIIEDYEKKGYVKKIEKTNEINQWFLPHFAVIKEERTTTKTRIVFDAAAKDRGKSLNDAIRAGPKLQKDLLNVLIRFRRSPIALSGDISKMFLQVGLLKDDRAYHRFLWRNLDASREPDVYEFQRLVFGNTASPFCAQFIVQKHAEDTAEHYPEAADTVSNSMYVDDVLDSCETSKDAIELRRQLSELLNSASFRLRKWSSNDKSVLEDVPEEDRQPGLEIREDGRPTGKVKTLGVTWKSENDVFTCKCRPEQRDLSKSLSIEEVKKAEFYWFKRAQTERFQDTKGRKSLENLNPMKDEDGLLRIDGRLRHADIPYESKHPVILPKEHPITELVVRAVHEQLGHGSGVEHTLSELRSRFWVIKGRAVVRKILNQCQVCKKRFTANPVGQMMAPLPRPRVISSMKAFCRVGVDYGGPYLTKQGRGKSRAKRYLCLFTCLVTRAVHLEMAYALDTDSFMNAFARMVSRRGTPSYVLSDNGTNFVSGERELRELVEQLDQEKIVRDSSRFSHIEWHFNPPASPHFGGVFEAMIKVPRKL